MLDKEQMLDAICNHFGLESRQAIYFAGLCEEYASYSVYLEEQFASLMMEEIFE